MTATPLRIGTRASRLAMAQSRQVADRISAVAGLATELVEVTTAGDVDQRHLVDLGGAGVFVGALRDALLSGQVDVAVHSLKDIPTAGADGLVVAAVPAREDPRDVLVARDGLTLGELPVGARVGTGSPRRKAQLMALGLGLDVVPVRGNVDTRLRLVSEGTVDAVVLARAGLGRIDRLDAVTETPVPARASRDCSVRLSTTPRRGRRSTPSGACSPRWKQAAPHRSARSPRSHWATTARRSGYAPSSRPSTARS
jgi:hydroxymethylbilane synthase